MLCLLPRDDAVIIVIQRSSVPGCVKCSTSSRRRPVCLRLRQRRNLRHRRRRGMRRLRGRRRLRLLCGGFSGLMRRLGGEEVEAVA